MAEHGAASGHNRALLRLLAGGLAGLSMIGLAGGLWPLADIVNAGLVAIVAGLLAMAPLAAWRRDRPALTLLLAGLLLAIPRLVAAIPATPPPVTGHDPIPLSIVTLSAYRDNPQPGRLRAVIEGTRADIVLLEESDGRAWVDIQRSLPGYHRLTSCGGARCSITLLSRWPLIRTAWPRPGATHLPDLLAARIARPGAPFGVIAVHLPRITRPEAARHRADLLAAARLMNGRPLLVGGDFNLVPGMIALADFERQSRLRRIPLFAPTYPARSVLPALFAIDHLYASPHWSSRGCRRLSGTGSDHLGLWCHFDLNGTAPHHNG